MFSSKPSVGNEEDNILLCQKDIIITYMMKKKLLPLLFMIPMLTLAQSIEVKYSVYSKGHAEVVKKIKNRKENLGEYQALLAGLTTEKKDSFVLVIDGRMSSYERIEPDEELTDNHRPKIIVVNPSYSEESVSVYKNLSDMSVTELKDLLARTYSITHPLPRYQWNVSTESKEIMGLQTYKATIGDSITAWFCPTIPVQDGPGLYCGLPGLILDLEDGQTIYSCMAINTNSAREVGKPKKAKEMTEEEFASLRRRTIESLKQRSSQ